MAGNKVIVFGPTGAVGSSTAKAAEKAGSNVSLAMRDVKKDIQGISAQEESQGRFQRVHADLTKPATMEAAVRETGAKHAFLYLIRSSDGMRAAIEALQSAGITFVVFLSSFTIQQDLDTVPSEDTIPHEHAQVEINLRSVFGSNGYLSIRPAAFATNLFQYKQGIQEGEVKIWMPDAKVDCIVPDDIGRVCGRLLAERPTPGLTEIFLCGPKLIKRREVIKTIAKVLGRDPKITALDDDEYIQLMSERFPKPVVDYMVRQESKTVPDKDQIVGYNVEAEWLRNIERYSGQRATSLEEWLDQNKAAFLS